MPATRDHEFRTLTSAAGRFIFSKEIPLAQAKLIRDTVTSQILKPDPALPSIHNEEDAQAFMLSHVAGPTVKVGFGFERSWR